MTDFPRMPDLRTREMDDASGWIDAEGIRQFKETITTSEIRRLLDHETPVILELGCNDGSETQLLLDAFPNATIHCFEPDPRPLDRFKVDDPRCHLHQMAIAAEDGVRQLHMSGGSPSPFRSGDWDYSSSIRQPTGHLSAFPWCTFGRSCEVICRSLDSWMAEHPELEQVDFIWADLQGAEGELIRGGRRTLREKTRYLFTEFYEQPMYEGQPTREQILELLPEFVCVSIYRGENMLLRNERFSN